MNGSPLANNYSWAVNLFYTRKTLAKLGYTSPLSELTAERADILMLVAEIYNDERAKEMKRGRNGKK